MKVTFISNFHNHHQMQLCDALIQKTDNQFTFIATEKISDERLTLGYRDMNHYPYVLRSYEDEASVIDAVIMDSDVVIYGSAPHKMIEKRLKAGKLTFAYFERIYKKKPGFLNFIARFYVNFKLFGRYSSFYLLAASAYSASDFAKTGTFIGKAYKWGYFPLKKVYENPEEVLRKKNPVKILWCGRLIDWKHPEKCITLAKALKQQNLAFEINLIGSGEMMASLEETINREGLSDCVRLLGSTSPEEVRTCMEESSVFLFTSDRNEGWGAVLNESMNCLCAVVANKAIGSVPFLMENGENGLIYEDGDDAMMIQCVERLLRDRETRERFGLRAYETIQNDWNAESAADRLIELSKALLKGEDVSFADGPCSKV